MLLSQDCTAANGARHIALADGVWRDEALDFDRAFYFFDDDSIEGARASWRVLSKKEGVEPRFWRQEGRKWVKRSEEHTSELQSLMRISYAVFCLKKKTRQHTLHE